MLIGMKGRFPRDRGDQIINSGGQLLQMLRGTRTELNLRLEPNCRELPMEAVKVKDWI